MNRIYIFLALIFVLEFAAAKPRVTDYIPRSSDHSMPAVILCPGGSYRYLGMEVEGTTIAKWLNEQGIAAFVLRYRVAPSRFPAMIEDLQEAILYCRKNAAKLGIDPNLVGVMGFSAGGHLAGISAVYDNANYIGQKKSQGISLRPDFVAMIYPVVTMSNEEIVHRKSRRSLLGNNPTRAMLDSMSLEKNVHRGMPPLFIIHSTKDDVVDPRNSVVLSQALERAGSNCKLTLYTNGTHGFGIDRKKGKDALDWKNEFLLWFNSLKTDG